MALGCREEEKERKQNHCALGCKDFWSSLVLRPVYQILVPQVSIFVSICGCERGHSLRLERLS